MGKVSTGGRVVTRWLDVKDIEGGYGSVQIIHGIEKIVWLKMLRPVYPIWHMKQLVIA